MHPQQIFAELSRLYALEIEAAHAYAAARAALLAGPIQDEVTLFGLEHQLHVIELHEAILALGFRAPEVEPDVQGVVIGALDPPRRRLTLEDVLEGLRGDEQLTNSVYTKVLQKPLPPELRERLERLHADERRHLAWVERMVARRVWNHASPEAHP